LLLPFSPPKTRAKISRAGIFFAGLHRKKHAIGQCAGIWTYFSRLYREGWACTKLADVTHRRKADNGFILHSLGDFSLNPDPVWNKSLAMMLL
jgi:hypothetical protein